MAIQFEQEILNEIPGMRLEEAKAVALELVEGITEKTMKQKIKKNRLKYDIRTAQTSDMICGILYRVKLSFEGIGVVGSKWQEHYSAI